MASGPNKAAAAWRNAKWGVVREAEYRTEREAQDAAAQMRREYPAMRVRVTSYRWGSWSSPQRSWSVRAYERIGK